MTDDQPGSLVKFCHTDTALHILRSSSLRWSSPAALGDPFELNQASALDFGRDELLDLLLKQVVTLLFGPQPLLARGNTLHAAINRWRQERRFGSASEAMPILRQLLRPIVDNRFRVLEAQVAQWQAHCERVRICCFGDKPQSVDNWLAFGDRHRGAVLRFACGETGSLSTPRAVHYGEARPGLLDIQAQAAALLDPQPVDGEPDFNEQWLNKGLAEEAQREWRCFRQTTDSDGVVTRDYDDVPFAARELQAVYFGLAMPVADRQAILQLVRERYPMTTTWQAVAVSGRYQIEFVQVV